MGKRQQEQAQGLLQTKLYLQAALLVTLAALDLLSTHIALDLGAIEINPVMLYLLDNGGAVVIKLAVTIALAAWLVYRKGFKTLILANVLMTLVVINNIVTIIIMRGVR